MNRRRRRQADHPHASHERWLISYADFITLLFAFFVVMYAASRGSQTRVIKLAQAIQTAFAELGMFTPSSTQLRVLPASPAEEATTAQVLAPLAALKHRLGHELAQEIAQHEVTLNLNRQGLVIRLAEAGFFDSGSDQLRPGVQPTLARIAQALAPIPNLVRVEGHTDNVPIHNARFASNWQLSTARATELVRLFVTTYHLDPVRLSAAGYAQFHPIASNATADGRQLNRRVDVVVVAEAVAASQAAADGPVLPPPAPSQPARPLPAAPPPPPQGH
ncbi:MAG TPA: flagellar motor protein MotB [Terriglobales bacterium]|nr:flagellar motor protein MotB [Terriglobales bacterium]